MNIKEKILYVRFITKIIFHIVKNKNLCSLCENEHKKENDLLYFREMIYNINDSDKEEFKNKIEQFNNNIDYIYEILDKTKNRINMYYKIYYNIVENININLIMKY